MDGWREEKSGREVAGYRARWDRRWGVPGSIVRRGNRNGAQGGNDPARTREGAVRARAEVRSDHVLD